MISTEAGQTHTKRNNNCVRLASLIGSKLAKISCKLERVEKNRYRITWRYRTKISYDVSLANIRAPGVCFVPGTCF